MLFYIFLHFPFIGFILHSCCYFVDQRSEISTNEVSKYETGNGAVPSNKKLNWLSQHREIAPSSFQEPSSAQLESPKSHKCCAYISSKSKYCARLNSVQAYNDINREVRILCIIIVYNFLMLKFRLGFEFTYFLYRW